MMLVPLLLLLTCVSLASSGRLTVHGTHFEKDGKKVFLSGVNQAWIAYGYDFGDHAYDQRHSDFEKYLKMVHDNGGNSIRVWVHLEGQLSPHFDSSGHVTGLDQRGTFISEVRRYLHSAKQYNILVFFCLWNGAQKKDSVHWHLDGLIRDTGKLQSYIDKALIPWVKAVKDEPAMGGWDIINEMEGELRTDISNSDPCFDTHYLSRAGAGFASKMYSAQEFLRFINWQADAIRRTDPQALVTAGSWNTISNVDHWGGHNLYKDSCLKKAGGKQRGTLTFYSTHTYAWSGSYDQYSPFKHSFGDYGLDKPLVVAEFNQAKGGGMSITQQFDYIYTHGYSGGWSWHIKADGTDTDSTATQLAGLRSIKGRNNQHQGGQISIYL